MILTSADLFKYKHKYADEDVPEGTNPSACMSGIYVVAYHGVFMLSPQHGLPCGGRRTLQPSRQ